MHTIEPMTKNLRERQIAGMIGLRVTLKFWTILLLVASVLMGTGCRFPWPPFSNNGTSPVSPLLNAKYHQAVTAYQAKDYPLAAKQFKSIQDKTQNKEMARKSLFGLACARLMAAQTPSQYQEAVDLWESWAKVAPASVENENPVFMVPIIKEKMLFSNIPLTQDGKGDIEASPKVSQWLVINAAEEVLKLRGKLESADQTNRKLKKRMALLEQSMVKLQRKIKALETIDQKIQEKKSAIPSTD